MRICIWLSSYRTQCGLRFGWIMWWSRLDCNLICIRWLIAWILFIEAFYNAVMLTCFSMFNDILPFLQNFIKFNIPFQGQHNFLTLIEMHIQATHELYECVTEKIPSAQKVYLHSDENLFLDALSRLNPKKIEVLKYSGNAEAIFETSTWNKYVKTPSSALSLRSKAFCLRLNDPVAASDHIALSSFAATRLDLTTQNR